MNTAGSITNCSHRELQQHSLYLINRINRKFISVCHYSIQGNITYRYKDCGGVSRKKTKEIGNGQGLAKFLEL